MMNENRPDPDSGLDAMPLSSEEKDALRRWSADAAPGEERVTKLVVPMAGRAVIADGEKVTRGSAIADGSASRPYPGRGAMRAGLQALAAVLIFAFGFYVGNAREPKGSASVVVADADGAGQDTAGRVGDRGRLGEPSLPRGAAESRETVESRVSADAAVAEAEEECAVPQLYKDNEGHLRMDTVLCGSGNRATWVINPTLEIAQNTTTLNEEEVQ